MMDKFTTLVFKSNNPEELEKVREISKNDLCRAWSMDHEILRLELIEKALDENNVELAKSYFGEVDVTRFLERLNT